MSWYNNNWKYRKKVTINQSMISGDINNFTLSINLYNEYDIKNYSREDLLDIVITDIDDNILPRYIDYKDSSGNYVIKCNININTIANELYIYYGNDDFIDNDIHNTYKSYDFISKQDMEFDDLSPVAIKPVATPLNRKGWDFRKEQEVKFNKNAVPYGFSTVATNDQYFISDKVNLAGKTNLSVSCWVKKTKDGDTDIIGQENDYWINISSSDKLTLRLYINETSKLISASKVILRDVWTHIAFTWSAQTELLKLFIDGTQEASGIIRGSSLEEKNSNFMTIAGYKDTGSYLFTGEISDVRVSTTEDVDDTAIKTQFINDTEPTFMSFSTQELSPSLIEENGWISELVDYGKKIIVPIKQDEIIGVDNHNRFPFLLNLYDKHLNEASPYANDIFIADEFGNRLPFERFLYRQHINQTRFAGAYKVQLFGNARLIYDTNSEGGFRAGYLSSVESAVQFDDVRVIEQGAVDLKITFSNGSSSSKNINVTINGTDTHSVSCQKTGSWTLYESITIPINITQEYNTFRLGNVIDGVDIDSIEVLGQDLTQLKGFVLLPELKSGEDTNIHIYYNNDTAPIRFNPAYGRPDITIEAESFDFGTDVIVVNESKYNNGVGVKPNNPVVESTIYHTWKGQNGWYDITAELLSDEDNDNNYIISLNGDSINDITVRSMSSTEHNETKIYNTKRFIYIKPTDVLSVSLLGNSNTTAGLGSLVFKFSLFDTNPDWNSSEVWADYEAVWHLSEIPGESKTFNDYSGNERHLTSYNMDAGLNKVNNSIGAGVKFYDNNDLLYGQFDEMRLSESNLTVSMWEQQLSLTDSDRGVLVSDNLNIKIDNKDEVKFRMGEEVKAKDDRIKSLEYFNFTSLSYDHDTKESRININGINKESKENDNYYSGLNDNLTIGRHNNQEDITRDRNTTFKGVIAEVRIRKSVTTDTWQSNEYKNILQPQQYIDYDTLSFHIGKRDYVIETSIALLQTVGENPATITIERDNSLEINMDGNIQTADFSLERNMDGIISTITGSSTISKLVISRINIIPINLYTAPITADYTIEFIRIGTGGITTDGDNISVVSYETPTTNKIKFIDVGVTHQVDDGFTISYTFNNAIGGKSISSGGVFNNYCYYSNSNAGGLIKINNTIQETKVLYNNTESLIECFVSVSNTTNSNYIPTQNKPIIEVDVSYRVENIYTDIYTAEIAVINSSVVENSYFDNSLPESVISSGQVSEKIYYHNPSDVVTGILKWKKTITENTYLVSQSKIFINITRDTLPQYNKYVAVRNPATLKVANTNSEVITKYSYSSNIPIHINGDNLPDTMDVINIDAGGVINLKNIKASIVFIKDDFLDTTITNAFSGSIKLTTIINTPISHYVNNDILAKISLKNNANANTTYNTVVDTAVGLMSGTVFHIGIYNTPLRMHLSLLCDVAKCKMTTFNEHNISYTNITEEDIILTGGFNTPVCDFETESQSGVIKVIADYESETSFTTITDTLITLISGSIENSETNFIYTSFASVSITGSVLKIPNYCYIPAGVIQSSIYSESVLDVLFSPLCNIIIGGVSTIEDKTIFTPICSNGSSTLRISAAVIISTRIVEFGNVVISSIPTMTELPFADNSAIGDIYYISDVDTVDYVRFDGSNYVRIMDPFINSNVGGVYSTVDDLPIFGNDIGDIYLVGNSEVGTYYYWNNEWVLEDIEQPTMIVLQSFNYNIKPTGVAITELVVSYECSSGYLNIDIATILNVIYNTVDLDFPQIKIEAEEVPLVLSGLIEISTCFIKLTSGTAVFSISNIIPTTGVVNVSGGIIRNTTQLNMLSNVPVIKMSAPVNELSNVMKYNTDKAMVLFSGEFNIPKTVIYEIETDCNIKIQNTTVSTIAAYNTETAIDAIKFITNNTVVFNLDSFNSYVKIKVNNIEIETITNTILDSIVSVSIHSFIETTTVYSFIPVMGESIKSDILIETEAEYKSNTITTIKILNTTTSVMVETDILEVSYIATGGIKVDNRYLSVSLLAICIANSAEIKVSGNNSFKLFVAEQPSETTTIIVDCKTTDSIIRNNEMLVNISIANNETEIVVDFYEENDTCNITITGGNSHLPIYYEHSKLNIKLIDTGNEIIDYTPATVAKIYTTGVSNNEVFIKETGLAITTISGVADFAIGYIARNEEPKLIITKIYSAPNTLIVNIETLANISIIAQSTIENNFIHELSPIEIKTTVSSYNSIVYSPVADAPYLRTKVGLLTDVEHEFEIVRDSITNINFSGELDYTRSGQSYNTTVGDIVIKINSATEYAEASIYTFYPYHHYSGDDNFTTTLITPSGITSVSFVYNFEYDVIQNIIEITGNRLDPTEYYLVVAGKINLFGSAISRLRYNTNVSINTIVITTGITETNVETTNDYRYNYYFVEPIKIAATETVSSVFPTYQYVSSATLSFSGTVETERIYDYNYIPFIEQRIMLNISHTFGSIKHFISPVETEKINITNTTRNYNLEISYVPQGNRSLFVLGSILELDISLHYYNTSKCLTWSKGTIANITDVNVYINSDAGGYINISGVAKQEMTRLYYYNPVMAHLGSILVRGNSSYTLNVTRTVTVSPLIFSGSKTTTKLGYIYIQKRRRINITPSNITQINFSIAPSGIIVLVGEALSSLDYITELTNSFINTSGNATTKMCFARSGSGAILVNGIAGKNITLKPLINGWIHLGLVETINFVDYSLLDTETVKLNPVSATICRWHTEDLLYFQNMTNRREYEAGLDDADISTKEDTWENYDDFLNK